MYAAATRFNRDTKSDITIRGQFIPKGTYVSVPITALHRDPEYWPDPGKFDPERFTGENKAERPVYSFLPFGIGPRNCIGRRFAQLEALIAMGQNFRFLRTDKTEIPVQLDSGFLSRPKHKLFLKIEPK